jgi:hypothetical protein
MTSAAFRTLVNASKETKNLDKFLVGPASGYLGEGTHDVRITAVGPHTDRDGTEIEGALKITYEGAGGKVYNDTLYLMNASGDEYSYGLRMLWSALIPSKAQLSKFFELAAEDDKAFEVFTGMSCRITLGPGKGYQIRSISTGKFAAYELNSKGETVDQIGTEEYDDIESAKNAASALGYKRAFLRVRSMECTNKEANEAAFAAALASKGK